MDDSNLRTASVYINNLLLSRGLLKNGAEIDFARPDRGDGGVEGTMGRIMGVVNDLILRRDRDATQREKLADTLRTLKSDTVRQTTELQTVRQKSSELQRRLNLADATERALKQHLRSAEQAAKGLKEEMARMRILVAQTRAACATEVRKRERTIDGLKRHVEQAGRQRGTGKSVGVATVNVVAGVGADAAARTGLGSTMGAAVNPDEEAYDLRQETNEFLTELAKGLSEENEHLTGLLRETVSSLRSLSGFEKDQADDQAHSGSDADSMVISGDKGAEAIVSELSALLEHLRTLLTNPSFVPLEEVEIRDEEIARLREGWERMEARWRDAVKLMESWRVRMTRSGQTVNLEELKQGLRLSPVKLSEGFAAHDTEELEEAYEEGDTQADIDAMDDSGVPGGDEPDVDELSDASSFDEEEFEEEALLEVVEEPEAEIEEEQEPEPEPTPEPIVKQKRQPIFDRSQRKRAESEMGRDSGYAETASESLRNSKRRKSGNEPVPAEPLSSSPLPVQPQLSPLRSDMASQHVIPPAQPRRISEFATIREENTLDLLNIENMSPVKPAPQPAQRPAPALKIQAPEKADPSPPPSTSSLSRQAQPDLAPPSERQTRSARKTSQPSPVKLTSVTRLPRPQSALPPQQSPLTMASIQAKLAATEREADAARVRAKLRAAKAHKSASTASKTEEVRREPVKVPLNDGDGNVGEAPRKRERREGSGMAGKSKNRRRSTLSPWELESLIMGGAGSPRKE